MIISGTESMIRKCQIEPEIKDVYTDKRIIENLITNDLNKICQKQNSSLEGLQYSVKTLASINDKLERIQKKKTENNKPFDKVNEFNKLRDILRYTQICEHDSIFTTANNTINELKNKGYDLIAANNYYVRPYPGTGYKGLHLNFLSPQGEIMELQIHSKYSFDIKMEGHELYEQARAIATPPEKKRELMNTLIQLHSKVQNPPDYTSIKQFSLTDNEINNIKEQKRANWQIYKSEHSDCLNFVIINNNNPIARGFEINFEDNSHLKGIQIEKESQIYSINNNGSITYKDNLEPTLFKNIANNVVELVKNDLKQNSEKFWNLFQNKILDNEMFKTIPEIIINNIEKCKTINNSINELMNEYKITKNELADIIYNKMIKKDVSQEKVLNNIDKLLELKPKDDDFCL